jgi:tetratricopeptide (TPR) repeat protein
MSGNNNTTTTWGSPRTIVVNSSDPDVDAAHDLLSLVNSSSLIITSNNTSTTTTPRLNNSSSNRMQRALAHKEQGNVMFKRGLDYAGAAREYRRALHCMRRDASVTAQTKSQVEKQVRIPCYLNLTACELELGNFSTAERHCTKVLETMDPENVKALFRRSSARRRVGDAKGAMADIKRALVLAPTDSSVRKSLQELTSEIKLAEEKEREVARRMFS